MPKRKDKLTKEEQRIASEVMSEVKQEIKEETPQKIRATAKKKGIYSIIVGIVGIIVPPPFSIIIGFGALILARDAITNGERRLGTIGGVLGFIGVVSFVIGAGFGTANFGI